MKVLVIFVLIVCILSSFIYSAEKEKLTLEERVLVLETQVAMLMNKKSIPSTIKVATPTKYVDNQGVLRTVKKPIDTYMIVKKHNEAIKKQAEIDREVEIKILMRTRNYTRDRAIEYIEWKKERAEKLGKKQKRGSGQLMINGF